MPERKKLEQRLSAEADGREALYEVAVPEQYPVDGQRSASGWEQSHRRVTFYCPVAVLELIEREMSRSARSKTRVITDALREHLRHTPS